MPVYALLNEARTRLSKYPISLRREFPAISFRRDPSDDELALLGVVRVRETVPGFDASFAVAEAMPEIEADGHWHQRWTGARDPDRLFAIKEAARNEIAEAGRQDWLMRMAQLSDRHLNALLAVNEATTAAEVQQAIESVGDSLQRGVV